PIQGFRVGTRHRPGDARHGTGAAHHRPGRAGDQGAVAGHRVAARDEMRPVMREFCLLVVAKAPVAGMVKTRLCPPATPAQAAKLRRSDAVLGPAADGGWWALGLRDPQAADVLRSVPMSRPDTGKLTREALVHKGYRVANGELLSDVDTVVDAYRVASDAWEG